jgi:hypothetical protein
MPYMSRSSFANFAHEDHRSSLAWGAAASVMNWCAAQLVSEGDTIWSNLVFR